MQEETPSGANATVPTDELRVLVRSILSEHAHVERERQEPVLKAELLEERRKREHLERRVNELVEENQKSRALAEETDRFAAIRSELQRQGVAKVDLAFRAIKDDVTRSSDGRLIVRGGEADLPLSDFVASFVQENQELLPARLPGGSGVTPASRASTPASRLHFDMERIRPGMDASDLAQLREEVARVATQALSGK